MNGVDPEYCVRGPGESGGHLHKGNGRGWSVLQEAQRARSGEGSWVAKSGGCGPLAGKEGVGRFRSGHAVHVGAPAFGSVLTGPERASDLRGAVGDGRGAHTNDTPLGLLWQKKNR